MSEIATRENVEEAFDYVVSHLECKEQREKYYPQREKMCSRLLKDLANGTFRITEFNEMEVKDGPKVRRVQAPRVYGRIGCHADCKHLYYKLTGKKMKKFGTAIHENNWFSPVQFL